MTTQSGVVATNQPGVAVPGWLSNAITGVDAVYSGVLQFAEESIKHTPAGRVIRLVDLASGTVHAVASNGGFNERAYISGSPGDTLPSSGDTLPIMVRGTLHIGALSVAGWRCGDVISRVNPGPARVGASGLDFGAGGDRLDLGAFAFAGLAPVLDASETVGDDAILHRGDDTTNLSGIEPASPHEDNFVLA